MTTISRVHAHNYVSTEHQGQAIQRYDALYLERKWWKCLDSAAPIIEKHIDEIKSGRRHITPVKMQDTGLLYYANILHVESEMYDAEFRSRFRAHVMANHKNKRQNVWLIERIRKEYGLWLQGSGNI